jgi:hypothetical protein
MLYEPMEEFEEYTGSITLNVSSNLGTEYGDVDMTITLPGDGTIDMFMDACRRMAVALTFSEKVFVQGCRNIVDQAN